MSVQATYRVRDYHTGDLVYDWYNEPPAPYGKLYDVDGNPIDEANQVWVDDTPGGILKALFDADGTPVPMYTRSEEHTSELQSRFELVSRLLLEKKKTTY